MHALNQLAWIPSESMFIFLRFVITYRQQGHTYVGMFISFPRISSQI